MRFKGMLVGVLILMSGSFVTGVSANPLLSEVFYNPSGGDNGFEWVELYNPTAATIDLSAYSLGWGGNDYTYGTGQLSGLLSAGSYFVVGGPNGGVSYDLVLNFSPDIQNGGSTADGIALFDMLAGNILASSIPIDAVIYGTTNSNGLLDASGVAGMPDVNGAGSDDSLERVTLAGAWQAQTSPTPGSGPFSMSTGQIPEPPMVWLMAAGLMGMFGTVRRVRT